MAAEHAVAGKKQLTDNDVGIIRKAMAFRVKYRICFNGMNKRRIQIAAMGVHPCNRGGVYPNEDRVVGLNRDIYKWGADQDEADHNGITVEEVPERVREEYPQLRIERYTEYNRRKCKDKPLLNKCFEGHDVLYGNLSHNHLLLVLLSWANAAKWGEAEWCDADGCLHLPSLKAKDENFYGLINDGLLMEKLSWKMLVEEPDAASLISQALNKGQEAACKTSELTALAVLTGAVTLQAESGLNRAVTYETVKEKVRSELDYYVDEPEFIEMFDLVISLGANTSGYVKELLDFGDRFVDSNYRMLRLCAFTEVQKMPADCPRSKIAVLKRAYRKKPQYGYCPSPEPQWGNAQKEDLLDLEHLLQYFHVQCESAVAEVIPREEKLVFLSNVDVGACEAFMGNIKEKGKRPKLLEALAKYYWRLAEKNSTKLPLLASLGEKFHWMRFPKPSETESKASSTKSTTTAVADASQQLQPKLLQFDPKTGEMVGAGQDERQDGEKEGKSEPEYATASLAHLCFSYCIESCN